MCGIAGIFLQNQEYSPPEHTLKAMIQSIAHRGPDAQKVWSQNGIGLAHARLSIIDLDAISNQPMHDPDNGNVIVFNGEIYNYIELKSSLLNLGYKFTTKSDTEVILKAYSHWGVECLNHFNGMWAFALYDNKLNRLFCARDRLGVKPFIYGVNRHGELVFASEAKAIIKTFPELDQVNEPFLQSFIERDFFACYKETFYKNLYNLHPGHYFIASPGEIPRQHRYWNWKPSYKYSSSHEDNIQAHFKELLTDSIKLRFRSDVPIGACLSGGLDSSTIVGLASNLFNQRIHTFSCVYPNSPTFDESSYIQASSEKFNTIAKFVEPKHDDFILMMQKSIYEQDGPTGGPSILSQRAVMELASQNVKVVLDGQGADEILGGYHSYFRYSLLSHLRRFKSRGSLAALRDYWLSSKEIKQRCHNQSFKLKHLLPTLIKPIKFTTVDLENTPLNYFDVYENDDLNTLLLEHSLTNLTNLLHYEDRNSMLFSVESRLPFLDYRLFEFAFSLPSHYKIRGSTTKWLLHSVAKDLLPQSVLDRKDKMGFSTPAHEWFLQAENMSYFRRYLNTQNPLFDNLSPYMKDYLSKNFASIANYHSPSTPIDVNALWRFFTASMWAGS